MKTAEQKTRSILTAATCGAILLTTATAHAGTWTYSAAPDPRITHSGGGWTLSVAEPADKDLSVTGVITPKAGQRGPSSLPLGDAVTGGYRIVAIIGEGAICKYESLKSITLPASLTTIGQFAFATCTGLTSVTIPPGVTHIRVGAFSECESLKSVTLPASVTTIGTGAFTGCKSLTSITLPASLTDIGGGVFYQCEALASVTIPAGVTSIGEGAFFYCTGLKSVILPTSLTSIGKEAFRNCASLPAITLPASVTAIGDGAFYDCANLKGFTVAEANPAYRGIGGVLFSKDGTRLVLYPAGRGGKYDIPARVTEIGNFAFAGTGLTGVTIPPGVTTIGVGAFSVCARLKSVTLPASVTEIGENAFPEDTRVVRPSAQKK